jgi:hypothetical protein
MPYQQLPHDAIFIRWGRFQAGASGRTAIVAVCILLIELLVGLVELFVGRAWGLI